MPFTIGGDWIPSENPSQKSSQPVKVRLVKRGKSTITTILNLNLSKEELETLSSKIKKSLGCGGSVREETIEIQGDKVEAVKIFLLQQGVKKVV